MITKKKLEIILSQFKENPEPKPELEQYMIPSDIAAEIINLAYLSGDIKDKSILDLGCGTGRLIIGSVLMGAKEAIGIEVDKEVLNTVKENIKIAEKLSNKKISNKINLIHENISEFSGKVDTVIQNPPFGIQKLHADRPFLEKALECGKRIYSLHRHYEKSRKFLTKFIKKNGGRVERIIKFKFIIPYMFKFHKKPSVEYDVDLFVIESV